MTGDRRISPKRFPRVPFERRFYAFLIDFATIWLLSSFAGTGFVQGFVFLVLWLIGRVVVVDRNEGQSLGAWCMDIKVLDLRFRKIPDLETLVKREGTIGAAALLAMLGFNLFFINPFSTLLLASPLAAECAIAYADEEFNQAFHDRLFGTVVIQSRRGFSLDIRLKKLLAELKYRMRK